VPPQDEWSNNFWAKLFWRTNGIPVVCVGTVVGIGALSVLLIAAVKVYTNAHDVHTGNMGLE